MQSIGRSVAEISPFQIFEIREEAYSTRVLDILHRVNITDGASLDKLLIELSISAVGSNSWLFAITLRLQRRTIEFVVNSVCVELFPFSLPSPGRSPLELTRRFVSIHQFVCQAAFFCRVIFSQKCLEVDVM